MVSLRDRWREPGCLIVPGVYDALGAVFAEAAGFPALYLSGASISYSRLGQGDIGLYSVDDVLGVLAAITDRVRLPVIADGDTGFGNALNTQRTVRQYERAGAAAIQLEDQVMPKRCGHLQGKQVIPTSEMVGKLKAALDSRDQMLVIARTDAIAVEGVEAALERAERYVEAGADILFVEAPRTKAELGQVAERFATRVPLLANMVEGGSTPMTPVADLAAMGYRLAIFPGGFARAVAFTARAYFASLAEHGTTEPFRDRMLDFQGLAAALGTPELLERGKRYAGEQA
ncbi:MAG: isocitrate lyase/PEP mutase family protein [Alphaproteobacteria bacterium]|nr:isocitrate lyase/PEP mutase family protein [Alphaproteobacteria bacterium]